MRETSTRGPGASKSWQTGLMAVIWERFWRPAILLVALWGLASACGSAAEDIVASEAADTAAEAGEPPDAPAQRRPGR